MPLPEGFIKSNSPDLIVNNFCPVNVLNLNVRLILSDPPRFQTTQITYNQFSPSVTVEVKKFAIENVNRANSVLRYWHNRLRAKRAKKPETFNHAWANEAVFRTDALPSKVQRPTRSGSQLLELKAQRERLAYLLPADTRLQGNRAARKSWKTAEGLQEMITAFSFNAVKAMSIRITVMIEEQRLNFLRSHHPKHPCRLPRQPSARNVR